MRKAELSTKLIEENQSILYKYCSEEWHPLIDFYLKPKAFKKGEYIFEEGQEVMGIKFVKSGKVKVVSKEADREKIIRMAAGGDILGHRGLGTDHFYPVSAIALTSCEILFVPLNVFFLLLKSNPELAYHLVNFFADELRKAEQETKILVNYTVKQRIARALLYASDVFGIDEAHSGRLNFTPSRKDLAAMAGTTYESVIRTLSELDDQKVILLKGKEIVIKDKKALIAESQTASTLA